MVDCGRTLQHCKESYVVLVCLFLYTLQHRSTYFDETWHDRKNPLGEILNTLEMFSVNPKIQLFADC
jgi:hypothetical protein